CHSSSPQHSVAHTAADNHHQTALNALSTRFAISLLTATKGHASKRLVPDANGRPIKDPKHSLAISEGRIQHLQLQGLDGLRDQLQRVTDKQALVHGVIKDSAPDDVFTLTTVKDYTRDPTTRTRTLAHIAYPSGVRVITFDHDPEPEAVVHLESAADLMQRLR